MKVRVENLGILDEAEFEIGDLTIICGKNNTGKTYASYSVYGFLIWWQAYMRIVLKDQFQKVIQEAGKSLLKTGAFELNLENITARLDETIRKACENYSSNLADIYAVSNDQFKYSNFSIDLSSKFKIDLDKKLEDSKRLGEQHGLLTFLKKSQSSILTINYLEDKDHNNITQLTISEALVDFLVGTLYIHIFPRVFASSAERTGAVIFRRDLDFARNRMLDELGKKDQNLDTFQLFEKVYQSYALPIKHNVDFIRNLEDIFKSESELSKNAPLIIKDFQDILGGDFKVAKDGLFFNPKPGVRLKINSSSSSVRSLLDLGFFLKHHAQKDDMIVIDEPELNLHPENQRKIARLFARLVNYGVKIFITTHSDYIIKELNTLLMLNNGNQSNQSIRQKHKYSENELLSKDQLKVYVAEKKFVKRKDQNGKGKKKKINTFTPAQIDPLYGIKLESFDETIIEMNQIQEEIIYGEE